MKSIVEYVDVPVEYAGCTEGWGREFDYVVEKIVSQSIGRHCYNDKNIRGKNIAEFSIEEISTIIADVMLRVMLYSGWRDILKTQATIGESFQDIRTPV